MSEALAVICVVVWLYLIGGRGAFGLGRVRDTARVSRTGQWPVVAAVVRRAMIGIHRGKRTIPPAAGVSGPI
jgi:hypothetical protein